jgi:hypothetical protein
VLEKKLPKSSRDDEDFDDDDECDLAADNNINLLVGGGLRLEKK